MYFKKKGQNTAEYAIVIALVIGAAIAMQTYIKRALQGGTAYVTDKLSGGANKQYEPHYMVSRYETKTASATGEGSYEDAEMINATTGNVTREETARKVTRSGYSVNLNPETTNSY